MTWFEAIILGLVQGLTEFLPVSSSGHLLITKTLFGLETEDLTFEVVVHAATVLSIVVVFWGQIVSLLRGFFKFKYNEETKYLLMIGVSMIPVFVVGVFFKDKVEALFGAGLITVGCALLVTAALLLFSERYKSQQMPLTYGRAFIIGIAQAIAVIPGLSRSGSTIATGLLCGVGKSEVTQFSFLMVMIPVLGEAFLELVSGDMALHSSIGVLPLMLGFVSAFVSGLFACKFMIAIVRRAKLHWFSLYCAVAGVVALICYFV